MGQLVSSVRGREDHRAEPIPARLPPKEKGKTPVEWVNEDEIDAILPLVDVDRARGLFSKSILGRGIFDQLFHAHYVNPAWEQLVEFTSEEVIGQSLLEMLQGPLTDVNAFKRVTRSLQAHDECASAQTVMYSKSGKILRCSLQISQLKVKGKSGAQFYSFKLLERPHKSLAAGKSTDGNCDDHVRYETPLTVVPVVVKTEVMTEQELDDVLPYLSIESALAAFGESTSARGIVDAAYPFSIRFVNNSWEQLCGYRNQEATGQSLSILQGERTDKGVLDDMIARLKEFEERAVAETFNYTRHKVVMYVRITCTQLQCDGRPGAFYSFKIEECSAGSSQEQEAPSPIMPHSPKRVSTPQSMGEYLSLLSAPERSPGQGHVQRQQQGQKHEASDRRHHSVPQLSAAEKRLDRILPGISTAMAAELFATSKSARGIVEASYPFTLVYANEEWEQLCEHSSDEMIREGKSLKVLQGVKTDKAVLNQMIRALQGGKDRALAQTVNYTKNGREMKVLITSTQLLDNQGRKGSHYSFKLEEQSFSEDEEETQPSPPRESPPSEETSLPVTAFNLGSCASTKDNAAAERRLDRILPGMSSALAQELFAKSNFARGIVEASYPFTLVYANEEWEQLCEHSSDEMIREGKSLKVLQGVKTDKAVLNQMIRALQGGKDRALAQTVNYTKNGREMKVLITSTQLLDNQGRKGSHYSYKLEELCEPIILTPRPPSSSRNGKNVTFSPTVSVVLIPTRREVTEAVLRFET